MSLRRVALAYLEEFGTEVLRSARMPAFTMPALLFPSVFYAVFVCLLLPAHESAVDLFWLADYASFAAIAPGLFAFGVSAACERENGLLQLKRALPVPRFAHFGARLAVSMLITALSVILLMLAARLTGHILPQARRAGLLVLVEMFGTLPFGALGMLIGSFVPGRSAAGLVNLLLVPLAFFSGLLVPLQLLPQALRQAAVFSPGFDLLAVSLAAIVPGFPSSPLQVFYLLSFATILGGLAQWRLRRCA